MKPRDQKGPRQGRKKGPPSSDSTKIEIVFETQVFCGKLAIISKNAGRQRRAWRLMLHTSLLQPTKDDDAVPDLRIEGAVDPVQQIEVPPNLHASSPRCQQLYGMCHPARAMAVTRQNTRTTFGISRRGATELNASCDERIAHHGSTNSNLHDTEHEEGRRAHRPYEDPRMG